MEPGEEQLCLRRTNYSDSTMSNMLKLLQAQSLVDVTFVAETGESIRAHKLVLYSCSSLIEKMLNNQIYKGKEPIIFLSEVSFLDLQALILFMYQGEVIIPKKRICTFMKLAESLHVAGLVSESNIPVSFAQQPPPPPPPSSVHEEESQSTSITLNAKEVSNIGQFNSDENLYVDVDPGELNSVMDHQSSSTYTINTTLPNVSTHSSTSSSSSSPAIGVDDDPLVVGIRIKQGGKKRRRANSTGDVIETVYDDEGGGGGGGGQEYFSDHGELSSKSKENLPGTDWIHSDKVLDFQIPIANVETVGIDSSGPPPPPPPQISFIQEIVTPSSSTRRVEDGSNTLGKIYKISLNRNEGPQLMQILPRYRKKNEASGEFRCSNCKNYYKTDASLKIHKRHHCVNPTRFTCQYCGKQASRLQVLQSHYKSCKSKILSDNQSQ